MTMTFKLHLQLLIAPSFSGNSAKGQRGSSLQNWGVPSLRKLPATLLAILGEKGKDTAQWRKEMLQFAALSLPQVKKAPNHSLWDDVSACEREKGPKPVSKLLPGESLNRERVRREQLGLGRGQTLDHTHQPRPPSCPRSHNELKQQCEQLRFRR